jgi:hypothetical protein|tara:strand:+ start:607 stop:888 length:282 start_codon:yes stop_codon:yes gene_type:complete
MAFMLPEVGELVLGGAEELGAGNIIQGAENVATQFKNELIKGIPFGISEALAFTGATSAYNNIKNDLGLNDAQKKYKAKQNCHIKKGRKMRRI